MDEITSELLTRSGGLTAGAGDRPPVYKAIGISLAIGSGLFIGLSFVLKKYGLLKANEKYNEVAGEGYGYLKNGWWWTGMTLMIVGEICNFVAYAFTDAILVTPLGALSVVVTTVLSAIFLKERLSMVGKVACFLCIVGSVVIVLNAPASSAVSTIQEMQEYVVSPGFLAYTGVIIVGSLVTALYAGPRWGNQNMLVYISICSWIGGLSVVATQGLGAAIIAQAGGTSQFNQWFLYVLLVFVVTTLLTEIVYLNKALNIFNAAMVTPTYYVYFTSTTIITSAVLFRGFKGTAPSIITCVLGFLTICAGVVLLQLSKSAKDVPDAAVFRGDLDQIHQIADQEEPETEPRADAIRGTAALVRRISVARQKREMNELKRLHDEKLHEQLQVVSEDAPAVFEWDGIRRRRTTISSNYSRGSGWVPPPPSPHPPLGMTHFPTDEELEAMTSSPGFLSAISGSIRGRSRTVGEGDPNKLSQSSRYAVPMTHITPPPPPRDRGDMGYYGAEESHLVLPTGLRPARLQEDPVRPSHSAPGGAPPVSPSGTARRNFSFHNVFKRNSSAEEQPGSVNSQRPKSPLGAPRAMVVRGTEEERLGLVQGDSRSMPQLPRYAEIDEDSDDSMGYDADEKTPRALETEASLQEARYGRSISESPSPPRTAARPERHRAGEQGPPPGNENEVENYEARRARWNDTAQNRSRGHTPSSSNSRPATRRGSGAGGRARP